MFESISLEICWNKISENQGIVTVHDMGVKSSSNLHCHIHSNRVETPISRHPREAEKMSATGAGRLWLEFEQGFVKVAVSRVVSRFHHRSPIVIFSSSSYRIIDQLSNSKIII